MSFVGSTRGVSDQDFRWVTFGSLASSPGGACGLLVQKTMMKMELQWATMEAAREREERDI